MHHVLTSSLEPPDHDCCCDQSCESAKEVDEDRMRYCICLERADSILSAAMHIVVASPLTQKFSAATSTCR
jgi:hypothetical protein